MIYLFAVGSIMLISTERFLSANARLQISTFQVLEDYNEQLVQANFNSMLDAIIALVQLFVGEAWHEIAGASIAARGLTLVVWFDIYIVLVSLLFSNLLIGVIIETVTVITALQKDLDAGQKLSSMAFNR